MAWPLMPRVMVTGNADLPELHAARASGLLAAVLYKPWTREQILEGFQKLRQAPPPTR